MLHEYAVFYNARRIGTVRARDRRAALLDAFTVFGLDPEELVVVKASTLLGHRRSRSHV
jgi:predicted pyridoxine 5'-phosphate oxidase superfamily flavin-nucleotide-binding protein